MISFVIEIPKQEEKHNPRIYGGGVVQGQKNEMVMEGLIPGNFWTAAAPAPARW
jgi:hypothetical protein